MPVTSWLFPWRAWFGAMMVAGIVFSFTLTSAVPVWFDETFIVEQGRLTLEHGQSAIALQMRSDTGRPLYGALLGSLLQEAAYRVTAPSNAGPRVTALLGALASSGFLVYYLLLRGVSPVLSVILGLALLLDPLYTLSWRGARVDCWAFALLFASMSAIRKASCRRRFDWRAWISIFLGGAAATAGTLCWPSFLMLTPLLIVELAAFAQEQSRLFVPAGLFVAGGALVAIVVIAPFRQEFANTLAVTRYVALGQARESEGLTIWTRSQALFWSLALTPIVVTAGLPALARKRNLSLLAGFSVAVALIFSTMVYRLRVLYLLPYLYLAVASLLWREPSRHGEPRWRRWGAWASALMLLLGVGVTLLGTTLSGLSDRSGKNPLALIDAARLAVGSGPVRVFLPESDLYYAGRALGWRQFQCFDGCSGPEVRGGAFRRLLASFDYAVFRGQPDALTLGILVNLGFRYSTVMLPRGGRQSSLLGWHYGPPTYGPYIIYKRT